MVGKWENDEEKDYLNSNLPTSLSRIKKQISKLELLDNKKLYTPTTEGGILSVKIAPEKIYVLDSITGEKELMIKNEAWLRIV